MTIIGAFIEGVSIHVGYKAQITVGPCHLLDIAKLLTSRLYMYGTCLRLFQVIYVALLNRIPYLKNSIVVTKM